MRPLPALGRFSTSKLTNLKFRRVLYPVILSYGSSILYHSLLSLFQCQGHAVLMCFTKYKFRNFVLEWKTSLHFYS